MAHQSVIPPLSDVVSGVKKRVLSIREAVEVTGVSRATIYRTAGKTFPALVQLSPRRVGVLVADIEAWLAASHKSN